MVHGWSKCESMLAADCATVDHLSLVMLVDHVVLLTIPMVFHMSINRHVTCL
jgi:hypothetical protein